MTLDAALRPAACLPISLHAAGFGSETVKAPKDSRVRASRMHEAFMSSKKASPVLRVIAAEEQNLAMLSGVLQESSKASMRTMADVACLLVRFCGMNRILAWISTLRSHGTRQCTPKSPERRAWGPGRRHGLPHQVYC